MRKSAKFYQPFTRSKSFREGKDYQKDNNEDQERQSGG
jgi:hypothetical protein